jgi:CheY-like chemotaxis protein
MLLRIVDKWIDSRPAVLVADDSMDNRKLIEIHLKKNDELVVLLAENGQEAVNIVKKRMVSLILMDLEMPVLDGYAATKAIRGLANGESVSIIAMTAHHGKEEIDRAIGAGCSGYLAKPITKKALMEAVYKYIPDWERTTHD